MVLVLTMPGFGVSSIRFQAASSVCSNHLFIISCSVVPRKHLQLHQQIEERKEEREQRYNAMKQLLMDECGFSSSELKELLIKCPPLFRKRSSEGAQEAVDTFRDSGFTPDQVRSTIRRYPLVLATKAHKQLKPKIAFFRTLGFSETEVCHIISRKPTVLGLSLNTNLTTKISLLLNLFGSEAILTKAVRRVPGLVIYDIETLKVKIKFMENMGLSKNEVRKLLLKNPRFLCLSIDKIQKNMDFLINSARFAPQIVLIYPQLLNFSVENRLKPRCNVFEYLNSPLSPERPPISLVGMLCISEDDFFERFVEGSPEAKRLYGR